MANIDKYLSDIRKDKFCKDMRETFCEALIEANKNAEETEEIVKNIKNEIANTNATAEVIEARKGKKTLGLRLDETEEKISVLDENFKINTSKINSIYSQVNNEGITSTVFSTGVDFNANYFRIPFMCVTKRGTIIAGCDIRYNNGNDQSFIDLGIARSVDNGKTWTDKKVVLQNNRVDDTYSRAMDGTILYDEINDRVWLLGNFWNESDSNWTNPTEYKYSDWDIKVTYSDDDGINWSAPQSLRDLCPTGYTSFIGGVGSGITMKNGTLVFPIQLSPCDKKLGAGYTQSAIIYSSNGINWSISNPLPIKSSECNVVEINDNEILINARSDGSYNRAIYRTTNMGIDWIFDNLSNNTQQYNACMGSTIKIDYNGDGYILYSSCSALTRKSLDLRVLSGNGLEFIGVKNLMPYGFDGYSCLGYNKYNKKLFIVYEQSGNLKFMDITHCLSDLKKAKGQIGKLTKNEYKNQLDIFVSLEGNDNNIGTDKGRPIKTLLQASYLIRKYSPNTATIYIDEGYNLDFKIANIPCNVNIQGYGSSTELNIYKPYIRECKHVRISAHIKIVSPFSNDFSMAIENSNVTFVTYNLTLGRGGEATNLFYLGNVNLKVARLYFEEGVNTNVRTLISAQNNIVNNVNLTLMQLPYKVHVLRDSSRSFNNISVNEGNSINNFGIGNKSFFELQDGGNIQNSSISYNSKITGITLAEGVEIINESSAPYVLLNKNFVELNIRLKNNKAFDNGAILLTLPVAVKPLMQKYISIIGFEGSGTRIFNGRINADGSVTVIGAIPSTVTELHFVGNYHLY